MRGIIGIVAAMAIASMSKSKACYNKHHGLGSYGTFDQKAIRKARIKNKKLKGKK